MERAGKEKANLEERERAEMEEKEKEKEEEERIEEEESRLRKTKIQILSITSKKSRRMPLLFRMPLKLRLQTLLAQYLRILLSTLPRMQLLQSRKRPQ